MSVPSDMYSFVQNLNIPTITEDQRTILERPITVNEVEQAIRTFQNGKAPGPDGFTGEFYKALAPKLAPLLCTVFSETQTKGSLPQTFTQATISVTLKKNKDPRKCES